MPFRAEYSRTKIAQFNDNVTEILTLDFKEYLKTNRSIGTTIYGDGRKPKTDWPSEDSVGNFVRMLRFFMNDGEEERISIRCLGFYFHFLEIPDSMKVNFVHLRDGFNNYLDSRTRTKYVKEPHLTNRVLIDTFMWGKYVHQNDAKVRKRKLLENKFGYNEIHREFRITLWDVLDYIEAFYELNKRVLNYLDTR